MAQRKPKQKKTQRPVNLIPNVQNTMMIVAVYMAKPNELEDVAKAFGLAAVDALQSLQERLKELDLPLLTKEGEEPRFLEAFDNLIAAGFFPDRTELRSKKGSRGSARS